MIVLDMFAVVELVKTVVDGMSEGKSDEDAIEIILDCGEDIVEFGKEFGIALHTFDMNNKHDTERILPRILETFMIETTV